MRSAARYMQRLGDKDQFTVLLSLTVFKWMVTPLQKFKLTTITFCRMDPSSRDY